MPDLRRRQKTFQAAGVIRFYGQEVKTHLLLGLGSKIGRSAGVSRGL